MPEPRTIAVIGAGQMGGGIAQVAATSGLRAVVYDAQPSALERCKANHARLLARGVEKGKMTQPDADAALKRIGYVSSLDELKGEGADWIVEAIVEDAGAKKELFARLAPMFPGEEIVLATNTSSISITEIATAAGGAAGRVVGMHFFNPVPVMALVEVIPGLQTAETVVERTMALATRLGKTPLLANDRAGFVSNRVLMPMINEAFYAWMEGVAEPEAAGGLHRARHLRAHHGCAGRGAQQRALPGVPAAEATRDGGPAGGQERPRGVRVPGEEIEAAARGLSSN